MLKYFKSFSFERGASVVLMVLMGVVTTLSIADLIYNIINEIIESSKFVVRVDSLQKLLGMFIWVIIAIELFNSIRVYIVHHHFHVERIVLLSLIAVSRKVIILDLHELSGGTVLGIAAIIAALCGGYFILRRSPPRTRREEEEFEAHSGE